MCKKTLKISLFLALALIGVAGCKSSSTAVQPPLAPGFVNPADQTMFSTLKGAHDFYQVLQQDTLPGPNGQAPKWTPGPTEKQVLNSFAITLNAAEAEYQAFKAGTATQAQAQTSVDQVTAAESQLSSIASVPKP